VKDMLARDAFYRWVLLKAFPPHDQKQIRFGGAGQPTRHSLYAHIISPTGHRKPPPPQKKKLTSLNVAIAPAPTILRVKDSVDRAPVAAELYLGTCFVCNTFVGERKCAGRAVGIAAAGEH
jgi:hypothetical protein